ncbi:MAG: hypothetical protein ACYSSO_12910 [Planctomycetota bacterium]|jgi:hypothetical protein
MGVTGNPSKSYVVSVVIAVLLFNLIITVCVCYAADDLSLYRKAGSVKWSAGSFPILPWDWPKNVSDVSLSRKSGLHSITECNFNIAGFVKPEALSTCERLGLAAIVVGPRKREWSRASDKEIDLTVRGMVEKSGGSKAVIGYYITDEPGASEFPALAKAVRAVRKYAPGKIAYINLFPSFATSGAKGKSQLETDNYTEYLERFVREVRPQIISYDNYMVQLSQDLKDNAKAAKYYTNLLEVRRVALKYDLPFWNTVSSNQIRPFTPIPSPANLRFQAYTTLAAGGRGIAWYTYYAQNYGYAPIDKSNNRTLTWRYLQEVNRQITILGPRMNKLNSVAVYFTSAPPLKKLPQLPGKLVRRIRTEVPMMVGEFKHGNGTEYIMLVNLSLRKSAKFALETVRPYNKIHVISAEDGTMHQFDNESGYWLVAGQGVLIGLL